MNTIKRAFLCECAASVAIAPETVSLEFVWPGFAPRAGQFFLIKPRRSGVFLGRPICVADWKGSFDTSGILRFIVARRGKGSRELADIKPGEEADLIGPLGNYWAMADFFSDTNESSGPVALVGGGIGIAPLLALEKELAGGKLGSVPFDFYAGFRFAPFGLESLNSENMRSLVIATEYGSEGLRGHVTDFFTPAGYSAVFVCGPELMLKAVVDSCRAAGVPCYVSLEKHMACGVGACLGCTVKTAGGNRRCCVEGSIFNAGEVCFDT